MRQKIAMFVMILYNNIVEIHITDERSMHYAGKFRK